MPIYVYSCKVCSHKWEASRPVVDRRKERCPTCSSIPFVVPQVQKFVPFHEGVYEHIQKDPMHITSKRNLKDECRAREVTSQYIVD